MDLTGGAQACHIFWQVSSPATLGTAADFSGNIVALTSITADTGATVDGRLLAENGAVSLDNNTITEAICNVHHGVGAGYWQHPFAATTSGLASLFAFGTTVCFSGSNHVHRIMSDSRVCELIVSSAFHFTGSYADQPHDVDTPPNVDMVLGKPWSIDEIRSVLKKFCGWK